MPNTNKDINDVNAFVALDADTRRLLIFEASTGVYSDAVTLGDYKVPLSVIENYRNKNAGQYQNDLNAITEAIKTGKAFELCPEGCSEVPMGLRQWFSTLSPDKQQQALKLWQQLGTIGFILIVIKYLRDRSKEEIKIKQKFDPNEALKNYEPNAIAKTLIKLANNGKSFEEGEEPDFLAKLGELLKSLMGEGGLSEEKYDSVCREISLECPNLTDNDIPQYSPPQNSASKNPANPGGPQQPAADAAAAPKPGNG